MVSEMVSPSVGGLQKHVLSLSKALTDRAHEVCIATVEVGADSSEGIRVHRLNSVTARLALGRSSGLPFQTPLPDPLAMKEIGQLIRKEQPDVIHGHNWLVASAVARGRRPLVLTLHDYQSVCARRDLMEHGRGICPGPSMMRCCSCASAQYGLVRGTTLAGATPIGRRLLRPSAVIAVSGAVAERVKSKFSLDIDVIPNFIPDEPIVSDPPTSALPTGQFVMFAGVASPHKGLHLLLEMWRAGMPIPLVAACPSTDSIPNAPGVYAIRLTHAEIMGAWRRATLAIVPSQWAEPCATVVLEAMQAGVPVVATAVGGTPEMVRSGQDGVLVPPGDPSALRAAVEELVANPARRLAMAESAQSARYPVRSSIDCAKNRIDL